MWLTICFSIKQCLLLEDFNDSPIIKTWSPGQPDNSGGNENFIQINSNGQWNDAPETHKKGFVCEYVHA